MKKQLSLFTLGALLLMSFPLLGQVKMGVKAGLNYDSIGELKPTDLNATTFSGAAKNGFHLGVFGHIDLLMFYLRPELQFSKSKSQYGNGQSLTLNKLEVPILLGYKVLGPLSVFTGPAFQYILAEKGQNLTLGEIKENFTVGLQLGTRLQLGRFGLGIRFERGFTDNEVAVLSNNDITLTDGQIDTRAKQWIFSLSYDLQLKKRKRTNE